ncbi:HlyD family secretion protein [Dryocola clanedunensis]
MNSNNKVYRKGYFSAQRSRSEGDIVISPSLSMAVYAWTSILLVIALIAFLIFGQYSRKARLEGVVMPSTGLVKVVARNEGYIEALLVKESDDVTAGQILYQLNSERYSRDGEGTRAALKSSLDQQLLVLTQQCEYEIATNIAQQRGLHRRMEKIKNELHSAKEALHLSQKQAELTRSVANKYQALIGRKYISEVELKQKQIDLAVSEGRVQEQRRTYQYLQRELAAAESEVESLLQQGQSRQAELNRQVQSIHQQQIEIQAQQEMSLTAPVSGQVAAVLVRAGQTVSQNETLLTLVPKDADLQVELYSPSKSVGFIKPKQRVGLRFAAYPYEKFGVQYGTTRMVTHTSLTARDVAMQNPMDWKNNEGHYRIIIDLDKTSITAYGKQEPLRVGMAVSADVELESRYLYEWLMEPLWSLKGKI